MTALFAGAAGLLLGGSAGIAVRRLLAGLRRGTHVRAGPLEAICAVCTAFGAAVAWDSPLLALVVWIGLFGVALSAVDVRHHRLPDALTLPGIAVTFAVLAVTEWLAPQAGGLLRAAIAAAVTGALFAVPAVLSPSAMGWGDVKLVVSLAAATGYLSRDAVLLGVGAGFVLAAIVAIGGILLGGWTSKSPVPLGPFLLLGSWAVLLLTPF